MVKSLARCGECRQAFIVGELAHYTWYENLLFCDKCKKMMNEKVSESYLDWQIRKIVK